MPITAAAIGLPDARLYYAMCREHINDPSMWDDCVQEAAIHVWRMRERHPGHTEQYYHQCARRRIKEVAKRGTWLGYTSQRGRPVDPLRQPHSSLDAMFETISNQEASC